MELKRVNDIEMHSSMNAPADTTARALIETNNPKDAYGWGRRVIFSKKEKKDEPCYPCNQFYILSDEKKHA